MRSKSFPGNALLVGLMLGGAFCLAVGCPEPSAPEPFAGPPPKKTFQDDEETDGSPADGAAKDGGDPRQDQPQDKQPAVEPPMIDGGTNQHPAGDDQRVLFKDWPQPQAALFITGRQHGYIEPCGCVGLENQKGGLARRHALARHLSDKGWKLAKLDVGNQIGRFGVQPAIKFGHAVQGLKAIEYDAVGFGPDDLRLGFDLVPTLGEAPEMFVSANVVVFDAGLADRLRIIEVGGKKIGVTSILGDEYQDKLAVDGLTFKPSDEALAEVVPELEKANCDLVVLLAYSTIDDSKRLAQQFPIFDVVVTAGGAGEPNLVPEKIADTNAILVQVGTKGMYVGVIGMFDGEPRLRYERVPLEHRLTFDKDGLTDIKDSPEMLELLKTYQEHLKSAGLDGLGLTPVAHPSGNTFVGSRTCKECHEKQFNDWHDGVDGFPGYHAHATTSLIESERSIKIPRHYDPECLSCHVTGWNPQKYFPYESGYLEEKQTLLHGNGCENCHGPASEHVKLATMLRDKTIELTAKEIEAKIRRPVRLTIDEAQENKCVECHDLDNSPDFDFDDYWERIQHYN